MLCYRCGSHVPDNAESCGNCGQKLAGGVVRQTTATFSRRRLQGAQVENAPYKAGDVLANRYEIKDIVGVGPVGFVFRANDREVDVEVAVKVVNPRLVQTPDERKQFAKVIRLGRKLSHQNLIRVYEEGEDQEHPFFTMQFLEGLTLRKIIDLRTQKGEFFSLKEIEPILGQIAPALDAAHKVGPHSDLKPENIIVLPDLLKVADFGVALAIPHLPFVQAVKQRKADRYLAPEYVQGSEVDQRADLYSLGVIIGEMLTGLTPDGAIPELVRRNPEVPPQLEGLYRKALNSNPLARPKTASELFGEFCEITRRSSPPPLRNRPEAPSQPAVQRTRPSAQVSAVAGGAAVTVEVRKSRPNVVDKPPPPVPDGEEQIHVPLNGHAGHDLAPDATQPIDESQLTLPPPPPREDPDETQLVPSFPVGLSQPELIGDPTESRPIPVEAKKGAGVWFFVLFTFAGLSLGAAGGYWLLKQRQHQPPPVIAQAPTPVPQANQAQTQDPPPVPTPREGSQQGAQQNPPAVAETPKPSTVTPTPTPTAPTTAPGPNAAAQLAARAEKEKAAAEAKRKAEEEARLAEAQRKAEEERRAREEAEKRESQKAKVVAAAAVAAKPECPSGMRLISAGSFRMGTSRDDPMMGFDEKNLSSVSVGAFCVDIFEYPNARGAMPKVGVSWTDAKRLCEAKGKRLCVEEEWEKACKGPGNARYPYGNTYDANACNTEDELGEDRPLATAGRFQKCRSGYGIADMSGNAAEWTASSYTGGADKAQKGGSFSKPDYAARCSARKNGSPTSRPSDVGFRCCADPQ